MEKTKECGGAPEENLSQYNLNVIAARLGSPARHRRPRSVSVQLLDLISIAAGYVVIIYNLNVIAARLRPPAPHRRPRSVLYALFSDWKRDTAAGYVELMQSLNMRTLL